MVMFGDVDRWLMVYSEINSEVNLEVKNDG